MKVGLVVQVVNKLRVPKHIAIFGGSFDPPHLGHQALVEAALNLLNIDELWLMPVGLAVHKKLSDKASTTQRMTWLKQMFAAEKKVKIMDWEINSPKAIPAIDTLRRFHDEYPAHTPTWLMGMDSFLDLSHWVDYPQHQTLCNLAVFQRKGYERDVITNTWQTLSLAAWQQQRPTQAGHIVTLSANLPDISASVIRENVQANRHFLAQSTCNAILVCYDSNLRKT